MSLHGVCSRMHDGERWKPFRNQAQIVVSEACMTYSTRPMAGETKRTELPIQWHGDTAFSVDWSPVCRHWSKAATFRAHDENGVRGLEEQALHFWRYADAAVQSIQKNRRSHPARTPKSRPVLSRPTGASTTDDVVATAQTLALPTPSQRPGPYKTCFAAFDSEPYGPEYLRLTKGNVIEDVEPPMDGEGWAYGRLVHADGGRSEPGWYPHTYAQ